MDQTCSYEGCPGSPKNGCSCNQALQFCVYHIDKHLADPGSHSKRPLLNIEEELTGGMMNISKTVKRVIMTGKEMFNEICSKLVEITEDLTQRQESLIAMTNNLPSGNLNIESIKQLGEVGLKFKKPEDFRKMVDQHFSQEDATVDFALFTEDFQKIMEHLQKSNELLADVKSQTEVDRASRDQVLNRIQQIENSAQKTSADFEDRVKLIEENIKKREELLATRTKTKKVRQRVRDLENQILQQAQVFEEVNQKFENINHGIERHNEDLRNKEKNMREFQKTTEDCLNLKFAQLKEAVDNQVIELNAFVEEFKKGISENLGKRNQEIDQKFNNMANENSQNFNDFCDRITGKINGLENQYIGMINQFTIDFTSKVRTEIDGYKQFKKDEILRLQREEQERLYREEQERLYREEQERIEELKRKEAEKQRLIEEEEKKKNEAPNKGMNYSAFEAMNLEQKKNHFLSLKLGEPGNDPNKYPQNIKEIKMTNDGLYMFVCKINLGMSHQIVSLN